MAKLCSSRYGMTMEVYILNRQDLNIYFPFGVFINTFKGQFAFYLPGAV